MDLTVGSHCISINAQRYKYYVTLVISVQKTKELLVL